MEDKKPTYEELKKKVSELEFEKHKTQKGILRFLQKHQSNLLQLIAETNIPIKIESFFGMPGEFLNKESPNIKYAEGNYIKLIN